ncbi:MAG: DHH family phosphoesterase [Ruminococcus sp.]|nr:DHH family phosphoesterase [Ruminococcus sp.]
MLLMIEKLEIPIGYAEQLEYEPELLITVDCIYGESNVQKFSAKNIAVIDHHICSGAITLPELCEIRSSYGSCSSVIAKLFEDEGISVNSEANLATALYYGLFMDTNAFSESCLINCIQKCNNKSLCDA